MEINKQDLKYFAAHALTGLCSNPWLMSMEGRRHLDMKGLTIEKLAFQSGIEMVKRSMIIEQTMDKVQASAEESAEIATLAAESGSNIHSIYK